MPDWTLYSLGISSNGYALTLIDSLIVLGTSVGLSLLISLVYIFTRRKTGYQSSTVLTILFLSPCVAAIAAVKRELGGGRAALGVVLMQCGIAWVVAFAVHCVGVLLGLA